MFLLSISFHGSAQNHNYLNDDLIVIQAENPDIFASPWQVDTVYTPFSGSGYIIPKISTNDRHVEHSPAKGRMKYSFHVASAGTYEVRLRNYIPFDDGTENNDVFLRMDSIQDIHQSMEAGSYKKGINPYFWGIENFKRKFWRDEIRKIQRS